MKKIDSKKVAAALLAKLLEWERGVSRSKKATAAQKRHGKFISKWRV